MPRTQQPERPIRDHYDLLALWAEILPAVGVEARTLSIVFLDQDQRPVPTLIPIDDLPSEPDKGLVAYLTKMLRGLRVDLGENLVMLLSRPDGEAGSEQDLRWAIELEGFSDWPLCLGTSDGIQLLEPDDDLSATG